uniref:Peptidase_M41 domain-containing protein n=1 Tax=Globodera pallida TaxID=36090 RepID=A0A183BHK7_GLOPA
MTIIPNGRTAGCTYFWEREEPELYSRSQLKAKLAQILGGQAGETLFCGSAVGHGVDLRDAKRIAEMLVRGSRKWRNRPASRQTAQYMAYRKGRVMAAALRKGTEILTANLPLVKKVSIALLAKKTIYRSQLRR